MIISFGEILSKCTTSNVENEIKSCNLFSPDEDYAGIINYLKYFYSNLENPSIKIPSDVIFISKNDNNEKSNNQFIKESIFGKFNIFTFDITFDKIIQNYCDEHLDAFHYIITNPVTIMIDNNIEYDIENINDIDNICAELFTNILIIYSKNYEKTT